MHVVASLHPTPSPRTSYPPAPAVTATWSEDDQALLDILFMAEPLPAEPSLEDVKMDDTFSSPAPDNEVHVQQEVQPASLVEKQIGYKPLAIDDSIAIVNETYRSILAFSLSGRALSTGANIMGWEDKRLLDGTSLKFSLRKQFPGQNALRLMASTWQCLSDPECSDTKFRGLMTLRVLQRVNDDTIVAMRDSQSEDCSKIYRCVYILFRVRTRKGFLICVRSIAPERLTDPALNSLDYEGKTVQWVDMSSWFVFEHAADEDIFFQEGGAHIEYGGCMDNGDNESVAVLAMNTLSIVLRWETTMVGPLFTLPVST
ncbi:hypothetical protein BBO99_00001773 [Phytophthora kernoviae]|uniref:Uncharacterized protein n=2 Tax=Phytophthora kernoviae TaxID=325452 RepID=A0A421F7S8_9STRA|nr:hypothetical protein G195_008964 [Phytophthora kernoviae 00238/432]KAG2526140.1 hypothetical protein JM16_004067 [Phytophthora kernoviae]KAG2532061.1 hypothetical protein JM18_001459 [Phytophthora kernoviae]RLN27187.1 hypothetical protein BBI17_001544 [Phytophthora kernoviae]RLN83802.1 hypothetical protein BBO99_00001773 [Phytophthora kernoviae]